MTSPDPAAFEVTRLPAANAVFTSGPSGYVAPPWPPALIVLPAVSVPELRGSAGSVASAALGVTLRPAVPSPRRDPDGAPAVGPPDAADPVGSLERAGMPEAEAVSPDDFLGSDDPAEAEVPSSASGAETSGDRVPVADEPVAGEPIADDPVAREPVAYSPVADEPVAHSPVVDEPVVYEPVVYEPVVDEPVADEPVEEEALDGTGPGETEVSEEADAAVPEADAVPERAPGVPQRVDRGEWAGVVLVTGTDTDVGKTIVTAAVAAAAQASGLRVAVIKPGQTGMVSGAPTDIEVVARLAAPETTRVLAEYPEPMAPLAAATVAQLPPLELYAVVDAIRAEADKHDLVLVEGAGGLLVPMGVRPSGEAWTLADLATALGVKTIVVTRAGLGTLNHTALTLEALSRRDVPAGVVIGAWPSDPELVHWANLSELAPHLMGALPEGAGQMDPGVFRRSAPGWLTPPLYGVIDNWRVWAEETDGH